MTHHEHQMHLLNGQAERYWDMYEWSRAQGYYDMAWAYRAELAVVQMDMAWLYLRMLG